MEKDLSEGFNEVRDSEREGVGQARETACRQGRCQWSSEIDGQTDLGEGGEMEERQGVFRLKGGEKVTSHTIAYCSNFHLFMLNIILS